MTCLSEPLLLFGCRIRNSQELWRVQLVISETYNIRFVNDGFLLSMLKTLAANSFVVVISPDNLDLEVQRGYAEANSARLVLYGCRGKLG